MNLTINAWAKRNGLTKSQYLPLLEAWRRIHFLHARGKFVLMATPSFVKPCQDCFYGENIPRQLNWYGLTDRGKELVNDLTFEVIDQGLNLSLFELI